MTTMEDRIVKRLRQELLKEQKKLSVSLPEGTRGTLGENSQVATLEGTRALLRVAEQRKRQAEQGLCVAEQKCKELEARVEKAVVRAQEAEAKALEAEHKLLFLTNKLFPSLKGKRSHKRYSASRTICGTAVTNTSS